MGKPQRRRKVHFGDTHLQRRWRTRSRKRDLDQVNIRKILYTKTQCVTCLTSIK